MLYSLYPESVFDAQVIKYEAYNYSFLSFIHKLVKETKSYVINTSFIFLLTCNLTILHRPIGITALANWRFFICFYDRKALRHFVLCCWDSKHSAQRRWITGWNFPVLSDSFPLLSIFVRNQRHQNLMLDTGHTNIHSTLMMKDGHLKSK